MSSESRPIALVAVFLGSVLLFSSCSTPAASCPLTTPIGLDTAAAIAADKTLPFRFPLDLSSLDQEPYHAWFGDVNIRGDDHQYHAAEDYHRPAGTPVYAVAAGEVSFSGTAGGYGWLIIVDHPQFNLYSLYGHLSPSRWNHKPGSVLRGDLLGYLGDPDENGGSRENPLEPHLHFGMRAGQRADYPGRGEWRWMAGWIKLCPQDIGWLQPSLVITIGTAPAGGYPAPDPGFLVRWGIEILVTLAYTAVGVSILACAIRRRIHVLFLAPGLLLTAAGIVLPANRMLTTCALLAVGIILTGIGACRLVALRKI
jgi:murein DD-endopeptidase MepM/ murein hydrolase activator NlpD